jgi:hypothetical protein
MPDQPDVRVNVGAKRPKRGLEADLLDRAGQQHRLIALDGVARPLDVHDRCPRLKAAKFGLVLVVHYGASGHSTYQRHGHV